MNIGDVAKRTGVKAKTIRYYEDIGFLKPKRTENGYREFDEADLHKLVFIGRARHLGFSIESCRALLALYEDKNRTSAEVKQLAQAHLNAIDEKLVLLQEMHSTLSRLISACAGDDRPDCPIMNELKIDLR
ncbi:Cu(I)-responsive transcriptional regulator [Polycladidibacter hongkongensis]|uniref:Cu(I)-responsive transcriptional regulator n=1 Tax=Polycladidibacter hongkongensis TaxID=1647556 RepID=UPI00082DAC4A|nr:Cu(I)-responsive transcriptional regulator [Pseudovibrio hongkongensis]